MKKTTVYARKSALRRMAEARQKLIDQINKDVASTQLDAGIHTLTGADAIRIADTAGRICFIAAKASESITNKSAIEVDARILRGMAHALADIVGNEHTLEAFRSSINSGMAAATRMLALCERSAIAEAAIELERLLSYENGLWTSHIDRALGIKAA